ncbi:hypothetical protein [Aeromicrobium sp.]|uniref:hypothetical protein n=1 Tax=Aeromicrobium sp. TaxID=1871063 RepID=UPI0019CB2304|nr:hypothetical protein [Aeromicrobium sp.]MBC7631282.1 hypothetical protein [Aeromicrobium sp.]
MIDTAWDRLLDMIDHYADNPDRPVTVELEHTLAGLCVEAAREGSIDRELHMLATARWLSGLVAAHRVIRAMHPEVSPDDDLAVLRVIVTRWLHPARPGR